MKTILILVLAMIPVVSHADELPEHIAPMEPVRARTVDTEFKIETATLAGSLLADQITTKQTFDMCQSCREGGWFGHDSRNMPLIATETLAYDAGQVLLAYELKKHVHNHYISWVWRVPLLYQTGMHIQGAQSNVELQRRVTASQNH